MTKELAVNDKLNRTTDYCVEDNNSEAGDEIDLESEEQNLSGGEKDV